MSGLGGKRVVVMGGAGFLGSHLCDAIVAQGGTAVAIDNLVTGDKRNIAHLQGKPNFEFIEHDVTVPFDVKGNVDIVLNMASPASPFDYARLPIETLRVGSLGTEHGLQLALAKRPRSSRRLRARSTATRPFTRSPRATGAT